MKKASGKRRIMVLAVVIIMAMASFFIWQNNHVVITKSDYVNGKIPSGFDSFRIAHISDLHNKKFGDNQTRILSKIQDISPDIIVITGDLIDRRKYDLDMAMMFIDGAVNIAPVYYVSGNHEAWSGEYSLISKSLSDAGVTILDDAEALVYQGNNWISIVGVSDPAFLTSSYKERTQTRKMEGVLNIWSSKEEFKILLSHRPELFDLYCDKGMDLIFTGHAHGGQFRIPFVGGLIAPGQGLFPPYTSGSHHKNGSTMFVSRGLGNSLVPIRIFNRPEIVLVTLKPGDPEL